MKILFCFEHLCKWSLRKHTQEETEVKQMFRWVREIRSGKVFLIDSLGVTSLQDPAVSKLIVHTLLSSGCWGKHGLQRVRCLRKRQPVTVYSLWLYPEVTSILSGCVYYCWSLLESIWVLESMALIRAKNNSPSSCGLAILLAPRHHFSLTLSLGTTLWTIMG